MRRDGYPPLTRYPVLVPVSILSVPQRGTHQTAAAPHRADGLGFILTTLLITDTFTLKIRRV